MLKERICNDLDTKISDTFLSVVIISSFQLTGACTKQENHEEIFTHTNIQLMTHSLVLIKTFHKVCKNKPQQNLHKGITKLSAKFASGTRRN